MSEKVEPWRSTYRNMMIRCGHYKGGKECDLQSYRDRGITVCEEWRNSPRAFGDWLLAHGWRKGLQIDRYDNSKGYSPENCRVVTAKENSNNRRNTLRLGDGTSFAMFCSSIGIETCENGRPTRQYARILYAYSKQHKAHPELLAKANEYLTLLKRLRAGLDLLKDVREFRERCNASQMISLPET